MWGKFMYYKKFSSGAIQEVQLIYANSSNAYFTSKGDFIKTVNEQNPCILKEHIGLKIKFRTQKLYNKTLTYANEQNIKNLMNMYNYKQAKSLTKINPKKEPWHKEKHRVFMVSVFKKKSLQKLLKLCYFFKKKCTKAPGRAFTDIFKILKNLKSQSSCLKDV